MRHVASGLGAAAVVLAAAIPARGADSQAPASAPASTTIEDRGLDGREIAALVGAGVAVTGFGVGAAYGIVALSKKSDAEGVCPGATFCRTSAGVARWHDAESAASISTFAFAVGLLGALEAAVFWLTPVSSGATHVAVGPGSIEVEGRW